MNQALCTNCQGIWSYKVEALAHFLNSLGGRPPGRSYPFKLRFCNAVAIRRSRFVATFRQVKVVLLNMYGSNAIAVCVRRKL